MKPRKKLVGNLSMVMFLDHLSTLDFCVYVGTGTIFWIDCGDHDICIVGDNKTCIRDSLLWLHADRILCILCVDGNDWLLHMFLVCPQDIFLSENRPMRWWEGAVIRRRHAIVETFKKEQTGESLIRAQLEINYSKQLVIFVGHKTVIIGLGLYH